MIVCVSIIIKGTTEFKKLWELVIRDNKLIQDGDLWSLADGTKWGGSMTSLLVTSDWKALSHVIMSQLESSNLMLTGKSGRGKSVFLLYLIFKILLEAKFKKNSVQEIEKTDASKKELNPVILYVDRSGISHYVTIDQVLIKDTRAGTSKVIHYYFADDFDISTSNLGSHVTMAVTSGDIFLNEWNKRIKESGGLILYMPSLTLESMICLFGKSYTKEEIIFKFDVINGNPREFRNNYKADLGSKYLVLVVECIKWMFGDEYIPTQNCLSCYKDSSIDNSLTTIKQSLGMWIINVIIDALTRNYADSGLFKHYEVYEGYKGHTETYVSTFLGYVAGQLFKLHKQEVSTTLRGLFGSNLGKTFEFISHASLLKMTSKQDHWSWCSNTSSYVNLKGLLSPRMSVPVVPVPVGSHRKVPVLIRSIDDIKSLQDGEYGLPTVCNFPLSIINSIIYPNIIINMTISTTTNNYYYQYSLVEQIKIIAEYMKLKNTSEMKIIFMVSEEEVEAFQFPTDLGAVEMYLTVPYSITKTALMGLRSNSSNTGNSIDSSTSSSSIGSNSKKAKINK